MGMLKNSELKPLLKDNNFSTVGIFRHNFPVDAKIFILKFLNSNLKEGLPMVCTLPVNY